MPNDPLGEIVVIGAGGHAKVVIECLRHAGWNVIGCTDADPTPRSCAGVPVIGTDDALGRLRSEGVANAFCALGANRLRERVGGKLQDLGFALPSYQGPGAIVSSTVRIGAGVAIMPGAVINIDTVIGDFAIINTNANVDHDGVLGRAVHVGPGAALAGEVVVGDRSFIATGCAVIPQRRIGADTIVGAGSVVVRDLPSGVIAFGNPARVQREL
ncbi:acetyltransferase [Sphingomonas humi]|uniref:Acetyltransferase n=1 Tax=Sphingomonas humi TaxID=335630 RepID=A0ABP7S2K5_9SPHN